MSNKLQKISPYSGAFHSLRHQETSYAAEQILSILLKQIPAIHSSVDVGCGVGTFLSVLNKLGVEDTLGLDGDWVDKNVLVIPSSSFQSADLSNPPDVGETYDLAICLEVAEHLTASEAKTFIGWLCRLSSLILFSAAIPRQGGVHHLNEAWQSYWARLFADNGFYHVDLIRPQIWEDKSIPVWYRQNTLVYVKQGSNVAVGHFQSLPLDVVHPELYLMRCGVPQQGLLQRLFRRLNPFGKRSLG